VFKCFGKSFPATILLSLLFLFASAAGVFAQETEIDYNYHYAYPFSVGPEFQSLSAMSEYAYPLESAFEISMLARYPIPTYPLVHVLLQSGVMSFKFEGDDENWDHQHLFAGFGAGYANRFTKNIGVGGELTLGLTQSLFQTLDPVGTVGAVNLYVSAGARIELAPSYNIDLTVHPNIKFLYSFSPMKLFNGFVLGIGLSLSYRFGEDPDASTSITRSIRFGQAEMKPVFAALQSYYVKNPIGSISITNIETFPITNVDVSFFQTGYMDGPTQLAQIPEIMPGEEKTIEIFATFNDNVFDIEGFKALSGDIETVYTSKNKSVEQTQTVSYELNDKTAITWDDDRKIASFITPLDSALKNYVTAISQYTKNDLNPGLSANIQAAMQIYSGLTEIGTLYQKDPISPFDAAQENALIIDFVNLPRTTLKRALGDCDDLTSLYNSLLEAASIETGFITTPGHIYSVFNTGVDGRQYGSIHPDESMTININGVLWIPVEITMLGTDNFMAAWRRGAEEWNIYEQEPQRRGIFMTRKSWEIYRPVGLKETDLGLQYGREAEIVASFNQDKNKLIDDILGSYADTARESESKRDYNDLGIQAAIFHKYSIAESAFTTALSLDRNYLSPLVNLGNLYLLQERYLDAIHTFYTAEENLKERDREESRTHLKIMLNIARAYYELEDYDKSTEYYDRVEELDPELTEGFGYLKKSDDSTRASGQQSLEQTVIFLGDEEA
jgi:hypothetical protein